MSNRKVFGVKLKPFPTCLTKNVAKFLRNWLNKNNVFVLVAPAAQSIKFQKKGPIFSQNGPHASSITSMYSPSSNQRLNQNKLHMSATASNQGQSPFDEWLVESVIMWEDENVTTISPLL